MDLQAAYDWATTNQKTLKAQPDFDRIGVAGHSARGKHIPSLFIYANIANMVIKVALLSQEGEDHNDQADYIYELYSLL